MRLITLSLILVATLATTAVDAESIVSWGADSYNQVSGTPSGTGYIAIAGGDYHSFALQPQTVGPAVPEPAAILFGMALLPRRRRR